ncbi:hypothetical protein XENTR_v10004626 [Xenopus tropicalis]|nr:hypothetical protein XENTR_v10004626 [Xenopus tropicalis]
MVQILFIPQNVLLPWGGGMGSDSGTPSASPTCLCLFPSSCLMGSAVSWPRGSGWVSLALMAPVCGQNLGLSYLPVMAPEPAPHCNDWFICCVSHTWGPGIGWFPSSSHGGNSLIGSLFPLRIPCISEVPECSDPQGKVQQCPCYSHA